MSQQWVLHQRRDDFWGVMDADGNINGWRHARFDRRSKLVRLDSEWDGWFLAAFPTRRDAEEAAARWNKRFGYNDLFYVPVPIEEYYMDRLASA